jgi:hypothetical protein
MYSCKTWSLALREEYKCQVLLQLNVRRLQVVACVVWMRNTYRITNSKALGWKMQGGDKWHENAPKNVVTSAKHSIILFILPRNYFHLEYLPMLLNYTLKNTSLCTDTHTTQFFLHKMFFNRPVKKELLTMKHKHLVHFLIYLLWYFDPQQLLHNISITKITNVCYHSKADIHLLCYLKTTEQITLE